MSLSCLDKTLDVDKVAVLGDAPGTKQANCMAKNGARTLSTPPELTVARRKDSSEAVPCRGLLLSGMYSAVSCPNSCDKTRLASVLSVTIPVP